MNAASSAAQVPASLWIVFLVTVAVVLIIDLGAFRKKDRPVGRREAFGWVCVWVTLAAVFDVLIWRSLGRERALEFLTGYLLEQSLSVDNLFVILVVFRSLSVPRDHQHGVLFWGVLGAFVMRGLFILAGSELIDRFHAILYVFGVVLIVTGVRLVKTQDKEPDVEKSLVLRAMRRLVPTTSTYHGGRFFVRVDGQRMATPLLTALVAVEGLDLVFAIDSIPAIFAVTTDFFIVLTSNMFAVLGLRSMFFLLAHMVERVIHLHYGLALVLCFVGVKILIQPWVHIPIGISLAVVASALGTTVVTSWLVTRKSAPPGA
jgi:tellurite resistance protein TerC